MVFDFLRRGTASADAATVPEQKASATGPVVAYQTSGRVAWSPRDTVSLTRTGFSGNPGWVSFVKLIAEAAAALPLVLQDSERRYDVHPLLAFVTRPNPAQGRAELLEALMARFCCRANGYIEAVSGERVCRWNCMCCALIVCLCVPGADGWPVRYEYAVGVASIALM